MGSVQISGAHFLESICEHIGCKAGVALGRSELDSFFEAEGLDEFVGLIDRKKADVFLRADFEDLGGYDQVGVVLRKFVRAGKLLKIGNGIYTRAQLSMLDGKPVPVKGITPLMTEALNKLGVETGPTKIERAADEGRTTQVPSGRLIGVRKRVRRKLGYNCVYMRFERV